MIFHIVGGINGVEQFQAIDPIANAMFCGFSKNDACMVNTGSGKLKVIVVVGTKNITHCCRPPQVVCIAIA
jgi:hypothetical protein